MKENKKMKKIKSNFEYMLEFNKMIKKIEQEGYIYNYNETTGDVEFYDAEEWLIGYFYDEMNKEQDASDYKLACERIKNIFKDKIKF